MARKTMKMKMVDHVGKQIRRTDKLDSKLPWGLPHPWAEPRTWALAGLQVILDTGGRPKSWWWNDTSL